MRLGITVLRHVTVSLEGTELPVLAQQVLLALHVVAGQKEP